MKKMVTDYTVKKVILLCVAVAFVASVASYFVGWSVGMHYGKQIGEYEVIENAIISNDSDYFYLEYDGNVHYYE